MPVDLDGEVLGEGARQPDVPLPEQRLALVRAQRPRRGDGQPRDVRGALLLVEGVSRLVRRPRDAFEQVPCLEPRRHAHVRGAGSTREGMDGNLVFVFPPRFFLLVMGRGLEKRALCFFPLSPPRPPPREKAEPQQGTHVEPPLLEVKPHVERDLLAELRLDLRVEIGEPPKAKGGGGDFLSLLEDLLAQRDDAGLDAVEDLEDALFGGTDWDVFVFFSGEERGRGRESEFSKLSYTGKKRPL